MIYGILSTIAFILILPFWFVLGIFKPKLVNGFKEKLGFYGKEPTLQTSNLPTLLFYGVSVGEVIAMENLIKKARESFQNINIVLMTGTKTGQEIAHKKLGDSCDLITYFPFDFPFCINNMIKKIKPNAVFVMETELWPNFANIMKAKKIPLFIINGRISDRTYNSYKKLSFFFAPILKKYTNIFTQSPQDNEKLISIGADRKTTKIMGNLKFDIKKPDTSSLKFDHHGKILIAGSTHTGEDEIILDVFTELKKEITDLKLIIAPRHPERCEKIFELMQKTGFDCLKRSEQINIKNNSSSNPPTLQPSILLLDTMGELGKFYSVCDVAFIGGSFNKTGGHNPLEATIFNKPVISGPSIHNFKDIYSILTYSNAGKIVKTPEKLKMAIKEYLTNEDYYKKASQDCQTVFEQNKGALAFVIDVLQTVV